MHHVAHVIMTYPRLARLAELVTCDSAIKDDLGLKCQLPSALGTMNASS